MANVKVNKAEVPAPKPDAWDQIKEVTLVMTREEAKVLYTLTGRVVSSLSGPAGQASARVYHALDDMASGLYGDNNLYIEVNSNGNFIFRSK